MDKQKIGEIRVRQQAMITSYLCSEYGDEIILVNNDISDLIAALESEMARNVELGTLYLQYQQECNRLGKRVEALERWIKNNSVPCEVCAYDHKGTLSSSVGVRNCENCTDSGNLANWKFDEARFATPEADSPANETDVQSPEECVRGESSHGDGAFNEDGITTSHGDGNI